MLADTYLLSLSDTQAVTSLALLISTFFLGCNISAYHYDLVCSLVLMSSAAHIGSLAVMHKYFDLENGQISQIIRSLIRVLMILASFIMSYILFIRRYNTSIFPSFTTNSDVMDNNRTKSTGLVLPAACFIGHPGVSNASNPKNFTATPSWTLNYTAQASSNHSSLYGNSSSYGVSDNTTSFTMSAFTTFSSDDDFGNTGDLVALVFLTAACILAAVTSLVSFLSEGDSFWHHKFPFYSRLSCFVTTYGIAYYGLVRFQILHDWMNGSGWFEADDDGEKTVKSFGQLMPLILLSLPVLALIESLAGKSCFFRLVQTSTSCRPNANVKLTFFF
jgi:hypothetical protein